MDWFCPVLGIQSLPLVCQHQLTDCTKTVVVAWIGPKQCSWCGRSVSYRAAKFIRFIKEGHTIHLFMMLCVMMLCEIMDHHRQCSMLEYKENGLSDHPPILLSCRTAVAGDCSELQVPCRKAWGKLQVHSPPPPFFPLALLCAAPPPLAHSRQPFSKSLAGCLRQGGCKGLKGPQAPSQ